MENPVNQPETEPKPRESVKFFGISSQINLGPGSDTHRRFAQLMKDKAIPARILVEQLLDAYEQPHVETDNSEVIANLEKQVVELRKKDTANEQAILERDATINELKEKLEAARNEANENAVNGLGKQSQIEFLQEQNAALQKQLEGAIIVKPNPVSAYFLNEMAEREKTTPAKILERLFIDDLQNPRANNLPYTVGSDRIREVMEEMKKEIAK